jgi:hypothetical protein
MKIRCEMNVTGEDRVERSIDWLLENGSAPVRYMTLLRIVGEDPSTAEMRELWEEAGSHPENLEMFSKQKSDGSWCSGGSWAPKPSYVPRGGCTPVSPKYVTTSWLLSLLGDLGYTVLDPRIAKAVKYVLGYQRPNGVLTENHDPFTDEDYEENPRNVPCRMSIQLTGLAKVGAAGDPRVRRGLDVLLSWQREDGGWVQEGHRDGTVAPYKMWTRSCPWVTFFTCSALHASRLPEYRKALRRGLSFIVWHLNQKKTSDTRRFFWHGHEPVRELVMLAENGFGRDEPAIENLLVWLERMYQPETGSYLYNGKPISKMTLREDGGNPRVMKYRLHHLIEEDWLTYWMTRVEKCFL